MCEEIRRKTKQGFEVLFPYGDDLLSLNELLEKPEVVNYLRRNGREPSRQALCKRLRRGLRNESVSQRVVLAWSTKVTVNPVPPPRTRKPPIPPPRKKPIPSARTRPIPPPRTRPPPKTRPIPPPKTKPIPPPRTRPVPNAEFKTTEKGWQERYPREDMVSKHEKARIIGARARQIADGAQPKCSAEDLTSSLDIATKEYEQGLTGFKRRPEPRPKKDYIPISPSEVDSSLRSESDKTKMDVLGYLGLLNE